jgi:HrpA-like RNA helicase
MDQYSTPEIQRVPLDSLLLQMVAMGLPDARKFPFIEPPPPESIENSILSLKEQVCLNIIFVSNFQVNIFDFAKNVSH